MHHPLIVTIGWGLLARRATPAGISFRDVIDAFGTPEKHS